VDAGWPHKGSALAQTLTVSVDQFLLLRPGDHYLDLEGKPRKRPKLSPGFRAPMGQEFSVFLRLDNRSGGDIRCTDQFSLELPGLTLRGKRNDAYGRARPARTYAKDEFFDVDPGESRIEVEFYGETDNTPESPPKLLDLGGYDSAVIRFPKCLADFKVLLPQAQSLRTSHDAVGTELHVAPIAVSK
jgi:hypothetical protein